ncbi:polyketide synthase [Penicillium sp. IBT 16267x]|nr:polyketide synthase [Penicillium sp. IBT 16267x]
MMLLKNSWNARLAITLGTAYAALIDIAHLREGQTVLVQNAANAVGQLAIQVAQQHAAATLVTINSEEERNMVEALGVSPKNILQDNDSDLAVAISRLCSENGVNVVLHQSNDQKSLQSLWRCLAAAGVLVHIDPVSASKEDNDHNDEAALSMGPLRREAIYSQFNASTMLHDDFSRWAEILHHLSQLQPGASHFASRAQSAYGQDLRLTLPS